MFQIHSQKNGIKQVNSNGGGVPEIKVNDIKEDIKIKKDQSFELYEEIDEVGSFVEDNKILPEIVIKSTKVTNFFNSYGKICFVIIWSTYLLQKIERNLFCLNKFGECG